MIDHFTCLPGLKNSLYSGVIIGRFCVVKGCEDRHMKIVLDKAFDFDITILRVGKAQEGTFLCFVRSLQRVHQSFSPY